MISQNCEREIPENAALQQGQHEKGRKAGFLKCALLAAGIMLAACAGLSACGSSSAGGSSEEESAAKGESSAAEENTDGDTDFVSMIQTGYLGEFTDATVMDILDANFGLSGDSLDWIAKEMDGTMFVGFYAYPEGGTINDGTTVLFRICSDETFKVSGYAAGGSEDFESTEIADFLNNWYMNWYIKNRIGVDVPEEEAMEGMRELISSRFDRISGTAVLYGASKDYAGDRGNLSRDIDGEEPIDMTVTELINYYSDNMLDIYNAGADVNGQENPRDSGTEFNLERVSDKNYMNGTDVGCYEIYFYVENGCILFSVYRDGTDLIRQAEADVVDGSTLHFEGYDDWNIDFVWSGESVFHVNGTGSEIADMIGTEFFDASFDGGDSSADGGSNPIFIADGDDLRDFARDNANIGKTVSFKAEVGGNYSQSGCYLLYCYDENGSFVQIQASIVSGMNFFDGDVVNYTGVFDGFTGGGNQLQFSTVSMELQ